MNDFISCNRAGEIRFNEHYNKWTYLKREGRQMELTKLPPIPKNSDVLINNSMAGDEVTIIINVYGAKISIEGASIAHVKYAAICLNETLGLK